MEKGYYNQSFRGCAVNILSQSTIKMEKGYYIIDEEYQGNSYSSQSTIKMEKGYYFLLISSLRKFFSRNPQ